MVFPRIETGRAGAIALSFLAVAGPAFGQTDDETAGRPVNVCLRNEVVGFAEIVVWLKLADETWAEGAAGIGKLVANGQYDCIRTTWMPGRDIKVDVRPNPALGHGSMSRADEVILTCGAEALASDDVDRFDAALEIVNDGAGYACRRTDN